MPELPEVETVARGLQREIAGQRIVSLTLGKTDFIDNPEILEAELPGRTVERVERYGKFLLLRLSGAPEPEKSREEAALLVHLGMTGSLMPKGVQDERAKHTHVVMLLGDGRELRYVDPRRFGRMAYLAGKRLSDELQRFGLDPLQMSAGEFRQAIHLRKARIKALLLDQSVVRGVGNIYADESLWSAKIHPAELGARLKPERVAKLYKALQKILQRAILLKGSSIADFLDADGMPGEYQLHHRAYGREGKPCMRCKTSIRRIIVAGRSSYFCPNCQRTPRGLRRRARVKRGRRRIR